MAVNKTEDKSLKIEQQKSDQDSGIVRAANGVATTSTYDPSKDVEVTLSGHYTHEGTDYLPGDTITVRADVADALRTSGYAPRN